MSRESDSSSSGPQGRGGAAYPSGTPPYGSPRGEAGEKPAPGAAAQPEEPKTETTLTTRIKINIPGSRPIPPVVVRKPVGEESGMNGSAGSGGSAGSRGTPRAGERNAERTANTPRPDAPADEAPAGGQSEKTSDWFAPRKPQAGSAGPSSSTGSHAVPPAPGGATPPRGPSGAASPQRSDLPYFSDSPAPQEGGGSPFDGGARAGGGSPFDGGPRGGASPFDGATPGGGSPFDTPGGPARDHSPFDAPAGGPSGPSGPTTGPARGTSALNLPPGFSDPATGGTPRIDDTAELTPQPPAPLAGPGSGLGGSGGVTGGRPGAPKGPGGPKGTAPGAPKGKRGTKGPQDGGPGGALGGRDRVSGDTLVSGIPKVPGTEKPSSPSPFANVPAGEGDSAAPKPRPKIPEPINPPKKGRNKLVLVGVAVVVLAGVAYGAGLLLDHADVPNGTTALGVDIGGTTKEEAVKKLETALKDSRTAPLKLTVDGKSATLQPARAGLDIDPQATVRRAAGRDYNPVSVIGSLFGVHRTADPAVIVDDEKLQIALQNATGPGGASEDGGITFENGKAVPHYGSPHKAIDVSASKKKVTDAYRKRAATGSDAPVVLAAGTQQPQVSKAAVDRAMKQFAEPAMSGLVTVRTDAAHTVSFSPQKSIPKFLSFKIINGSLVPYYDRPALKKLYGDTFNGVMVTKGDGSKHPVSVEEVAGAVGKALLGTSPAERIQTIATDGN
ncbi:hypothetical protein [Streptomyces nigrescens]|uniref:Peptidoglycan binding domain-containing protein n=1 Tax=Streptomyces nigrescens TaxID=1920 RepID=A0ABY7J2F3_STRNI|nr:hypothetical protein [Streptomyces nigrescens]WAU04773.1 hypothetical protein STRNI_003079 [Streptomyces nigrescens]